MSMRFTLSMGSRLAFRLENCVRRLLETILCPVAVSDRIRDQPLHTAALRLKLTALSSERPSVAFLTLWIRDLVSLPTEHLVEKTVITVNLSCHLS